MPFIKVMCEYDIGGDFGGNNNQEVFEVGDQANTLNIQRAVHELIKKRIGEYMDDEDLEDLYHWEHITVSELPTI